MQSYHLRHQKTISKLHFLRFFHNQKGKKPVHICQVLQFHGSPKSKQAIKGEAAGTVIIAWE